MKVSERYGTTDLFMHPKLVFVEFWDDEEATRFGKSHIDLMVYAFGARGDEISRVPLEVKDNCVCSIWRNPVAACPETTHGMCLKPRVLPTLFKTYVIADSSFAIFTSDELTVTINNVLETVICNYLFFRITFYFLFIIIMSIW